MTLWRVLRRQQLGTRRARLAVWSARSAAGAGLLTERTVKSVRHVAASAPGDLLSLDTFYVGKLKGVGKVWQITGCDVASSFGWARVIVGEVTAAAVLAFLREISATKFAVRALTEGLRIELKADNIRSTMISPGVVATELPESSSEEATRSKLRDLYRIAIPADSIARAVAYAIEQPTEVEIDEIVIRPTAQEF